jgi:hypothetical protein
MTTTAAGASPADFQIRRLLQRLRNGPAPLGDPNLNDEAADLIERLYYERNAQRVILDCRTCRNHTTATGGCVSVLQCNEGSAYQRAGVRQCWTHA